MMTSEEARRKFEEKMKRAEARGISRKAYGLSQSLVLMAMICSFARDRSEYEHMIEQAMMDGAEIIEKELKSVREQATEQAISAKSATDKMLSNVMAGSPSSGQTSAPNA